MSTPTDPVPPLSAADADRWIDAMSAAMAMPLDAADRSQVRANLLVAHAMASLVAEFPLDDHEESLPVYRP